MKRVFSKKKEFASLGSKFFPFRADPFSEGSRYKFDTVALPYFQLLKFTLFSVHIESSLQSEYLFESIENFLSILERAAIGKMTAVTLWW